MRRLKFLALGSLTAAAAYSTLSRPSLVISVVPYGVLGDQLSSTGVIRRAPEPSPSTVVVDPAGLRYIHSTPQGAGGAAGALYSWLELDKTEPFPKSVRESILEPTDAKFYQYAKNRGVIHVVGPDFRKCDVSRDEGVRVLAIAYGNILREFVENCAVGDVSLRLLPVSGGIFSGKHMRQLPDMTAEAVEEGFQSLDTVSRLQLSRSKVELCVFVEQELDDYVLAFSK